MFQRNDEGQKPSCSGLRSVREVSHQLKQGMGDILSEEIGIWEQ